jgi:hypothetical protein
VRENVGRPVNRLPRWPLALGQFAAAPQRSNTNLQFIRKQFQNTLPASGEGWQGAEPRVSFHPSADLRIKGGEF